MNRFKKILRIVIPLLVLAGLGGVAWFLWDNYEYFTTDDAQVTADMITITPEVTGRLKSWKVQEGDTVKLGQVLGRQEVNMLVNSTALSSQGLANTADALINKVEIRSPLDGRVVQSSVIDGQVVSPGMEIATIADTGHTYIKANVEETDIFRIRPGQPVDVDIDAWAGRHFHGYVETIGQATQQAFNPLPSFNTSGEFAKITQLIPVKISIADLGDTQVMPGMNATVRVHTRQ